MPITIKSHKLDSLSNVIVNARFAPDTIVSKPEIESEVKEENTAVTEPVKKKYNFTGRTDSITSDSIKEKINLRVKNNKHKIENDTVKDFKSVKDTLMRAYAKSNNKEERDAIKHQLEINEEYKDDRESFYESFEEENLNDDLIQSIKDNFNKVFSQQGFDRISADIKSYLTSKGIIPEKLEPEEYRPDSIDLRIQDIINDAILGKKRLAEEKLALDTRVTNDSLASLRFNQNPIITGTSVKGIANNSNSRFSIRKKYAPVNKSGYDILAPWSDWYSYEDISKNPNTFQNINYTQSSNGVKPWNYIGHVEQSPGYIAIRDGKLITTTTLDDLQPGDMISNTYYSNFDEMSPTETRVEPNNSNEWHLSKQIRLKRRNEQGELVDGDAISSYYYSTGSPNSKEWPHSAIVEAVMPNGHTVNTVFYGTTHDGLINDFNTWKSNFQEGTTYRYYSTDAGYNKRSYNIGHSARQIQYPSIIINPMKFGGRKSLKTI